MNGTAVKQVSRNDRRNFPLNSFVLCKSEIAKVSKKSRSYHGK
jgi:hypothetical protein